MDSTTPVSVDSEGNRYNFHGVPASENGRIVAFASDSSNLVSNDKNNDTDVFVNERAPFTTKLNVDIDIKPGNKRNGVKSRSRGGVWVAVLSGSEFDPLQIKIPTVRFGPNGAKAIRHKVKDINKDWLGDLLLRFMTLATGIACGDTEATLTGETFDGQSITGTDSIKTVGCKPKNRHKRHRHEDRKKH